MHHKNLPTMKHNESIHQKKSAIFYGKKRIAAFLFLIAFAILARAFYIIFLIYTLKSSDFELTRLQYNFSTPNEFTIEGGFVNAHKTYFIALQHIRITIQKKYELEIQEISLRENGQIKANVFLTKINPGPKCIFQEMKSIDLYAEFSILTTFMGIPLLFFKRLSKIFELPKSESGTSLRSYKPIITYEKQRSEGKDILYLNVEIDTAPIKKILDKIKNYSIQIPNDLELKIKPFFHAQIILKSLNLQKHGGDSKIKMKIKIDLEDKFKMIKMLTIHFLVKPPNIQSIEIVQFKEIEVKNPAFLKFSIQIYQNAPRPKTILKSPLIEIFDLKIGDLAGKNDKSISFGVNFAEGSFYHKITSFLSMCTNTQNAIRLEGEMHNKKVCMLNIFFNKSGVDVEIEIIEMANLLRLLKPQHPFLSLKFVFLKDNILDILTGASIQTDLTSSFYLNLPNLAPTQIYFKHGSYSKEFIFQHKIESTYSEPATLKINSEMAFQTVPGNFFSEEKSERFTNLVKISTGELFLALQSSKMIIESKLEPMTIFFEMKDENLQNKLYGQIKIYSEVTLGPDTLDKINETLKYQKNEKEESNDGKSPDSRLNIDNSDENDKKMDQNKVATDNAKRMPVLNALLGENIYIYFANFPRFKLEELLKPADEFWNQKILIENHNQNDRSIYRHIATNLDPLEFHLQKLKFELVKMKDLFNHTISMEAFENDIRPDFKMANTCLKNELSYNWPSFGVFADELTGSIQCLQFSTQKASVVIAIADNHVYLSFPEKMEIIINVSGVPCFFPVPKFFVGPFSKIKGSGFEILIMNFLRFVAFDLQKDQNNSKPQFIPFSVKDRSQTNFKPEFTGAKSGIIFKMNIPLCYVRNQFFEIIYPKMIFAAGNGSFCCNGFQGSVRFLESSDVFYIYANGIFFISALSFTVFTPNIKFFLNEEIFMAKEFEDFRNFFGEEFQMVLNGEII